MVEKVGLKIIYAKDSKGGIGDDFFDSKKLFSYNKLFKRIKHLAIEG
jgi:hypothetical protein